MLECAAPISVPAKHPGGVRPRSDADADAFNRRILLDEAATIVQSALDRRFLDTASSAVFHHLGMMCARIAGLQAAFPDDALHAIAIKANPAVEVLSEAVRAGTGLEAASWEEVQLAFAAGCPANRIVFDSPAKTEREIEQALQLGVYLNADNFQELDRIGAALNKCPSASRVGLRINALVGGGTIEQTSVSQANSKFGAHLVADRQRILTAFAKHDWLTGLHVHVGSQGCSLDLLAEAAGRIAMLRRAIRSATGKVVRYVDIGGGLPTTYRSDETAPTPELYLVALRQQAPELFSPNVRLITEFGRAVQANCGIAVSRVEYVKPAQRLAVIHLGADFMLRPVYRPDDWQHEFFVLDSFGRPKSGARTPQSIAGPLCFAGDLLARDMPLPPITPGDWIVVRDVGAYTLSMWSRHCSRGMPAVIGYDPQHTDALRVLRRAESPVDVVRFWSFASDAAG